MIKKVLSLVVFVVFVNAGLRLGMVYYHDQTFKDAVREYAVFAGTPPAKTTEVVMAKVMELAQDNSIPLYPDYVEITRTSSAGLGEKVTIKVAYAVNVALLPRYFRRFDFVYTTP